MQLSHLCFRLPYKEMATLTCILSCVYLRAARTATWPLKNTYVKSGPFKSVPLQSMVSV